MAQHRLVADEDGRTRLEPLDLIGGGFENGPGEFKGVGGAVLGNASRVMLMRFDPGAHPGFHRAVPSFAVLLEGTLVVSDSTGGEVLLRPGDAIRVEAITRGSWRLGNPEAERALLALVPMPPAAAAS